MTLSETGSLRAIRIQRHEIAYSVWECLPEEALTRIKIVRWGNTNSCFQKDVLDTSDRPCYARLPLLYLEDFCSIILIHVIDSCAGVDLSAQWPGYDLKVWGLIPHKGSNFSLLYGVKTDYDTIPISAPVNTGSLFNEVTAPGIWSFLFTSI
jgi:hypothetical protein